MRKAIIFSVFLLSGLSVFSQSRVYSDDTLSVLYALPINTDTLKFDSLPYYDLNQFQQYRPFGYNRLSLARSGNLGLPLHSFKLEMQNWNSNHNIGAYQPYLFQKDSLRYYQMSRPFTQLRYTNGSEAEQLFNVFHSQNLGEGLNISFEYQRITSEGFYIRQLTNHTQFNSTFNARSRDNRFKSRGYFLVNDVEAQENGGVVISENESEDENTVLLDVNLRSAQNQSRTQGVGVKNEYDLLMKDSTAVFLSISHDFDWNKSYRKYSDDVTNSPDYYDNFFLDTVLSADSSFAQTITNSLFANFLNRQLNIGFKNEQYHYYQNSFINRKFASNYILAQIKGELFNLEVSSQIEKGISGFNKEELDWKTSIKFKNFKGINNTLYIHQAKKQPDYFFGNQRINHFVFEQNFKTSNYTNLSLRSSITKYRLSTEVGYSSFNQFVYSDSLATPKQFNSLISSFYVEVNKKFVFLKHWNFANRLRFQSISNKDIIPLPSLISFHSLYYENLFFKESLLFQIGADLYYIGENNAYQYSPALAQFHLRNSNESLGNTLQIDLFVAMRINKSARIFVKMENVNNNSFSEKTNRINEYPIPGRSLKVGLSWRMIN